MDVFDTLQEKKGFILTPSNWISLDGVFTPNELRLIANKIEANYKKIPKKVNGDTSRHISKLESKP
ncbi:MAG: hypothetical protein U9O94_11430 [Nanoarchaeota archaeon]|nr:hypothetical protein [Nanoarchaeota archaeon]